MQYFYEVRSGDTVDGIAKLWKLPVDSLIAANNLTSAEMISAGQQLSIPTSVHSYTVQSGDSVYRIAQLYGIPSTTIIETNELSPPYILRVNQTLSIPPGVPYYTVRKGDTLFDIAKRYNVSTAGKTDPFLIQQVNELTSDTIHPNMQLKIPVSLPNASGSLAYTANHDGQYDIWQYNLKSGEQERLTDGIGDISSTPIWSPDGRQIAFVGKNRIIYIIYVDTKLIAAIDQLAVEGDVSLDWSPDSTKIAYSARGKIVLYDVVQHETTNLDLAGATNVNWFSNGSELLFQAVDSDGISQLYRVQIDGENRKQMTRNEGGPLHDIRLSPDDAFALYTTPGASLSLIRTIELTTGKVHEVQGGPLGKNYSPEWSPNSLQIAYSATVGGEGGYRSQIRTVSRLGEEDRVRAVSNCFETPVTWSPDGKKLAYLSGCLQEEFAQEIWVIDLGHPVPMRILEGVEVTSLNWSPNKGTVV